MSIPQEFINLINSYDCSYLDGLADALDGKPSVSVRINRRKALDVVPFGVKARVPWCDEGYHLLERGSFTFDPALHQGAFYVQDASSMFISHVVKSLVADSESPLVVLDACAAPGGKTTAIIDALPWGSLVVANEFDSKRASILRENLAKWGYPYLAVTQGDTVRFRDYPSEFDIIAADVPCSGEGMMRKDAVAVEQWSPALVKQCVARQREIIDNLWGALRPGGYLIYSTCTFNRDENELMLAYLAEEYGAETVQIETSKDWNIVSAIDSTMSAYRFIPGRVEGEGLFMGVVRKPLGDDVVTPRRYKDSSKGNKKRKDSGAKRNDLPAQVKQWLNVEAEWSVDGDKVMAVIANAKWSIKPQIHVATIKGRDLIPSQALALSVALNSDAFARVEVSREVAIDYLRCEAVCLPDNAPKGIVLLCYSGRPLGFAKNLGNRANNFYPRNWRIVSQRPSELPALILQQPEA